MFLVISVTMLIAGYSIVSGKGASWYLSLVAGLIPAAFCLFLGFFGLPIAACLLGAYFKIEWPT